MSFIFFIPGILQGFLIAIDEFYFHRQRGLPPWEIWGHPLDTLTVAMPFGIVLFLPPTFNFILIYSVLAVFSSVFVTKDEFVHAKLCRPGEHWLHSLLFIIHPLSFIGSALLWIRQEGLFFLIGQFFLVTFFMIYQIIYWGFKWKSAQKS